MNIFFFSFFFSNIRDNSLTIRLELWLVSIIGLICVWTKSLVCKDAVLQGIFHYSEWCKKILPAKSENLWFPVSRPDDRAILSGRPFVYCSIRPDDMPYHLDASQTKHHPSGRRTVSVRTSTISRSYCSSLYPSGRLNSPSGRLSVIDQLQILSKFKIRKDWYTRLDDVDSSSDALI